MGRDILGYTRWMDLPCFANWIPYDASILLRSQRF